MAQRRDTSSSQRSHPSVDEYNAIIEGTPAMVAYREQQRQGALCTALGPPRMLVEQIPQTVYRPSDRAFKGYPAISFQTLGGQFKAVKLTDALRNNAAGLLGAKDPITLSTKSGKVNVRLLVRGEVPFARSTHARRACKGGQPLQRRTIARHVAKAVQEAIIASGGVWRLSSGRSCTSIENLWLVELQHVSGGSWQPVLAFYDTAG